MNADFGGNVGPLIGIPATFGLGKKKNQSPGTAEMGIEHVFETCKLVYESKAI
jgi:hypothetical protein